jgi:uncharacterized membrane protein (DUF373 family)
MAESEEKKHTGIMRYVNGGFVIIDDIILIAVAIGIISVAIMLLIEGATDIFYFSAHTIPHIVSDMMFVLIIMELFRQVMRQIVRHTFSLNPFLYIGIIASIRGILLTQMSLSMGEVEWQEGIAQLVVHGALVLILIVSHLIYNKSNIRKSEETTL